MQKFTIFGIKTCSNTLYDEALDDFTIDYDDDDDRYASTTCEVAVMQNNSGALIAVEPDHRVWAAAEVGQSLL